MANKRLIDRCKRDGSFQFAVLFLDIDNFKHVNDSLGHSHGDRLLIAVAELLTSAVRSEDTVARIGGDEFTILLSHIEGLDEASHVADTVVEMLADPFVIDGVEHFVGASIGIVNDDTRESSAAVVAIPDKGVGIIAAGQDVSIAIAVDIANMLRVGAA